ncbi:hypothetical protein Trydic_g22524 [Trypoxylus dichotomus]
MNTRPPRKNLNTKELKALIELTLNENITILPADKGNATVVRNTRNYKDNTQKLLDDRTYKPITTDLITYLEKTNRAKINSRPLSEKAKESIILR